MGSKTDGFICDHVKSNCCKETIRFKPTSDGYSIEAWCSKCGNYIFTGRTETLIALWYGDSEAVIKNKGYLPTWLNVAMDGVDRFHKVAKKTKEIVEGKPIETLFTDAELEVLSKFISNK